jgi:hypothetical protein
MLDPHAAAAPPRGFPARSRRPLLALAALGAALAAGVPQAKPASARATYDALARRARAGDRTVDVAKLREAAGEAGVTSAPGDRERLTTAARKGDARALARVAEAVLARNAVDLWAHHYAAKAAATLGDARGEDLHRSILVELVNAITASGDGLTPATPMVVLSDDEASFLLLALHVELEDQGLGTCGGRPCEVMQVRHPDGSPATWYFEVRLPAARKAEPARAR